MSGKLYLLPTPIGNLGDLSRRFGEVLASVDFVAAEDTRVSMKLLNHLQIKKPMVSYYAHNRAASGARILERLLAGESCALMTDAGTPAISDPGEELVADAAAAGVEILSIPGPCAAIVALAASGLPTGRFTFEGFLSTAKRSRQVHLEELKGERRTMIFYEAPHKLLRTLTDMRDAWGDRRISISRELTKLHEQTLRTTLAQAVDYFTETPPKGEFVLVVEGAAAPAVSVPMDEAVGRACALREQGVGLKQAVRQAAEEFGVAKNALYGKVLELDADR